MDSASVTVQTRQQVERAQRVAEEARERIRAAGGGRHHLEARNEGPRRPWIDEDAATDFCID